MVFSGDMAAAFIGSEDPERSEVETEWSWDMYCATGTEVWPPKGLTAS